MSLETVECAHDEIIEREDSTGDQIGTCRKCGQVKRYPRDGRRRPSIIKAGVVPPLAAIDEGDPRALPVERKREIALEAKEHGCIPVAEKYGYPTTLVRGWIGAYCRSRPGGRPKRTSEPLPPTPDTPQIIRSVLEIQTVIEAMEQVKGMLNSTQPSEHRLGAFLEGNIKALQWILGQQ